MLDDVAEERARVGLVVAPCTCSPRHPPALLPVGNLAALDRYRRAVAPHHPREQFAERCGSRPVYRVSYAQRANTPTSALVDAKIFSPSLTLS